MQYDGKNNDVIIDEEFKRLLPPLEAKVFADLEESLLTHGVRDKKQPARGQNRGDAISYDGGYRQARTS